MKSGILNLLVVCQLLLCSQQALADPPQSVFPNFLRYPRPQKKLIEFGWSTAFLQLSELRSQIQRIERVPFDGMTIHLNYKGKNYKDALNHEVRLTQKELRPIRDLLKSVKFKKFTDNFISVYTGERHLGKKTKQRFDWFNDEHWRNVLHNISRLTEIAKTTNCKGLMFDPEGYNRSVWNYDRDGSRPAVQHHGRISYQKYCEQVRLRGRQYMAAIQKVMPKVKILSLYHPPRVAPSIRGARLGAMFYPFLNGMLDVAGPGVTLIDGNEFAYSAKTKADFDRLYTDIRQRKLAMVDPRNRAKYRAQVQAAQALYMDEIFGINQRRQWTGTYLSYENRLRLFEQVLYHSLDTCDEYVWIYSERMNWWRDHLSPEGATQLMKSVKRRVNGLGIEKRELPFSLDEALAAAKQQRTAVLAQTKRSDYGQPLVKIQSTKIKHLSGEANIDGATNEQAWKFAASIDKFTHHLHYTKDTVKAPTAARLYWTDKGLYLACKCTESRMKDMNKELRRQNRISLLYSVFPAYVDPNVFFRFDLTMSGKVSMMSKNDKGTWTREGKLGSQVKLAVQEGKAGWTLECLIPWTCLGGKPRLDSTTGGNLIRIRSPDYEFTNWSKMVDPNLYDTQRLGRWQFKK